MGRKVLVSAVVLAGVIVLAFFGLGILSHYQVPDLGLQEGKLRPCPDKPNCVCSEHYPDKQPGHEIPPVRVNGGNVDLPWKLLKEAVIKSGGSVVTEREDYLHAEFTSKIFRFVDDLEMRLDRENGEIHFRSASRVGHSDLGANRKRVERIWKRLGTGEGTGQ